MANIYKNAGINLTTTDLTTVYTVPANRTAIIKNIQISNEHSSNNLVEVFVTDSSASATYEIFHESMAADSTTNAALAPIILESGDALKIQAANAEGSQVEKDAARDNNVEGYPTIKLISQSQVLDYNGARNAEEMGKFVKDYCMKN